MWGKDQGTVDGVESYIDSSDFCGNKKDPWVNFIVNNTTQFLNGPEEPKNPYPDQTQ